MNISDFRVEPADYTADFDDIRAVRETVFINEQNIPEDIEFDNIDPNCHHFIARDNNHRAIGTGRLSPDRKIDRMAVLGEWRGKKVGQALLLTLVEKARKLGWTEVSLNAQTAVIGFYEKQGFTKQDNIFMEAGIPHQTMKTSLEPMVKSSRPSPKPRDSIVEIAEFTTFDGSVSPTLELINKARRKICIYSPDLECLLYGRTEIAAALKEFAIQSDGGNVLIIVQDTMAARSQPHLLLDLAQRLPSIFILRTPVESDDLQYPSAYLINDRDGYLFRQQSGYYRGVWSPNLPSRHKQLTEEFDRVWQRCRPCTEFKSLGL